MCAGAREAAHARVRARLSPAGVGMHSPPFSICALVRNVLSVFQFGDSFCGIVESSRTLVT